MRGSRARPFGALLAALFLLAPPPALANCSNPPQGFGGAWAGRYRAWCEGCCGTYSSSGPSCNPGSNWGCGGSGGGGAGGSGDMLQDFSQILLDAAERTRRAAEQGAAASRAGAAQVNSAAQKATQSVEMQRQNAARAEAARKAQSARQLSSELEGLPESAGTPVFDIPSAGGAVRILGDTPILMGGDPIAECRLAPKKRRWDLDCPRILSTAQAGFPAQWEGARANGVWMAGALDAGRPTDSLDGMRASLAEYLYSESAAKAKERAEEYLNSLGATGRAVVRVAKAREIFKDYVTESVEAIGGQMSATACSLGTLGPGCDDAFYKNLRKHRKATDEFEKKTWDFIGENYGGGPKTESKKGFLEAFL